jgi:acylphosphatase
MGNLPQGQIDFTKKLKKFFNSAKNIAPHRRVWLHPAVSVQPTAIAFASTRRRLKVLYSGRVQGVGFRYTAKTLAAGFEITGMVKNLPDGRVELTAEGSHAELEAYRTAIRDEGLAGFIRDEQITWADAQNEFRGFEISR